MRRSSGTAFGILPSLSCGRSVASPGAAQIGLHPPGADRVDFNRREAGTTRPWYGDPGSLWSASDPIVLETLTMRPESEESRSRRNSFVTDTVPNRLVSNVSLNRRRSSGRSASSAVASGRTPASRPSLRSAAAASSPRASSCSDDHLRARAAEPAGGRKPEPSVRAGGPQLSSSWCLLPSVGRRSGD